MENETKTADLTSGATDQAFKKKSTIHSLFDTVYYFLVIMSLLWAIVVIGSLMAEYTFK